MRVLETLPINVLRRSGGFPNEVPLIFVNARLISRILLKLSSYSISGNLLLFARMFA